MSWRHRGGLHMRTWSVCHRGAAGGDVRPRAPQQLGVRPREGGRAQRHGHGMEVDEPARVDLSVGRRRQGRQRRRGRSRAVPPAYWPVPAGRRTSSSPATRSPWISARRGTAAAPVSPRASRSPMAPCCHRRRRGSVIAAEGGHHVEDHCFAFRGARVPAAWIDGIDSRAGDAGASGFYRRVLSVQPERGARRAARGAGRRRDPWR